MGGRQLTLEERLCMATKRKGNRSANTQERAGLSKQVELAVGMEVMVTYNVVTDLDVTNGARGVVEKIVLDPKEEAYSAEQTDVKLCYPPAYVLVHLYRTKAQTLEGLDDGVVPLAPLMKPFTIRMSDGKTKTISRTQLPITPAYAFTDYRSQGQTLERCIIDIGKPPTGELTPFNVYVALSRSWGRDNIRLLRDFEDRLFTQHPSEFLRQEDQRLAALDMKAKGVWQGKIGQFMQTRDGEQ